MVIKDRSIGGIVHYEALRPNDTGGVDIVKCWGDMDKDVRIAKDEQEAVDRYHSSLPQFLR